MLRLCMPLPPVSWIHLNRLPGLSIDPSAVEATACKGESMRPFPIDDGQLKFAVERRSYDGLPRHFRKMKRGRGNYLDLDQSRDECG